MSQNVGTLVSAAIRPNDSNDPIASAFASEIKGGLHTANTINDRDSIIFERRDWGMLCYVIDEDKTYQLKYGHVTTNIMDSFNWVEYSGSGGGGSNEWLDSVISFAYQPPATYSVGDRFLAGKSINDSLLGDWVSFIPGVVLEWNSVSWVSTEPFNGTSVRVDNEDNSIYRYEGNFPTGAWYKEMLAQIRSMDATSINGQSYIASTLPPFDDYVKDMLFLTKFDTINSGNVSININSIGNIPIRKPSPTGLINLVAGDIFPDITYSLVYNGSVFELIKHYTGENALNIKYYIEPLEHVVVPPYHQYWVYGNLTIDGQMTNYGQVLISNGSLVNSNNFFNYGTISFIQFNTGTASPSSNLSVGDYDENLTFTNITSIKFRGGSVTTPTGPVDSVSVIGNSSNEVIVWIPAPSYEGSFSPSFTTSYLNRYVAEPIDNITNGSVAGEYNIGDWNTTTDFSDSTTRRVFNFSSITNAFITNNFFNCYGPSADGIGTTMSFYVYDGDDNVIASIDNFIIELSGLTSSQNLSMQVLAFEADSDRKKARVSGNINIGDILPYGGRFYYEVKHYNGEPNNEVITFTSSDLFFDSPDSQTGVSSTAKINGDVTFDEAVPQIRKYSGVSYYTTDSTFGVTVSNIDLLNEITFPTTKQIDVVTTNMAISSQHPGFADGSKAAGALITGWGINWDSSNLTYSVIATVDLTGPSTGNGKWIPGFSTNNTISATVNSFMTSKIYDYGEADGSESLKKLMLFDTVTPGTAIYNNNPITSESGRLQITSPTQSFNSNDVLSDLELQYIFGRVIFPQTNFTQFYPSVNFGASVDYSLLTGNTTNFDVITVLNDGGNPASSVVQSFTFSNYRWWVSSFGLSSNYGVPGLGLPVGNGVFTFNANFEEQDLHKNRNVGGVSNEDLVILVGYDSTGSDTDPDKFLFISADPVTYPGRAQNTTYNFDGLITSKRIAFDAGSFIDTILGEKSKIWLLIGYKDSNRGKNIYFSSVSFSSL